jgi:hypothetical protein
MLGPPALAEPEALAHDLRQIRIKPQLIESVAVP